MSQNKSKKLRKMYNNSIHKLANKDYKGILLKICRQRDWMLILNIIQFIVIIVLSIIIIKD